jgi:hypothetical protein
MMKLRIRKIRFYRTNVPVPKDMLRYDLAFVRPSSETTGSNHKVAARAGLVAFPAFHGGMGGRATFGRWESFRIHLEEVDPVEALGLAEDFKTFSDWVTYRHAKTDGATDYGGLVPYRFDGERLFACEEG